MTSFTFHPTNTPASATHSFFAFDPYIEAFWRPAVGPTATSLINELTLRALTDTSTFEFDASDLAVRVGTGHRDGAASPVVKQLRRLVQHGIFHEVDVNEFLIPRCIEPLSPFTLRRLDPHTLRDHEAWMARLSISPLSTQRRRAMLMIARLETMGLDLERIHATLFRTGLHPAVIGEAIDATSRSDSAA